MAEKNKPVGLKIPMKFFELLAAEAEELGESLSGYALKAVYERYNRDRLNTRFDRLPTSYIKQAHLDARDYRSGKELEKCG